MAIYRLGDDEPRIHASAWVADSAQVIGRVELGEQASVWYAAVLRGDTAWLRVGERSNIQDGAVLHADHGSPLTIGRDVTVGHKAVVHGCTVGDGCLVGIGSVILNDVVLGAHCVVGAGAVIPEGKQFPEASLILGAPAKVVKTLDAAQIERFASGAARYVLNAQFHREQALRLR